MLELLEKINLYSTYFYLLCNFYSTTLIDQTLGSKCIEYMESICTANVEGLKNNSATLTVFTNEDGGILDDLIITKVSEEHLYVVSNAARKDHDKKHLLNSLVNIK